MPITTSSFFFINVDFAASTASNAQLSLQDTAIAVQLFPGGGGGILGPVDFVSIQAASTNTVYTGGGNFGWAGGGGNSSPSQISTVFRVDFNNDTVVASVRGPLSSARYGLAAVGNTNYAWFGAGRFGGPPVSTVDRVDYGNDSPTTAIARTTIQLARVGLAAVGNANYGWFGGGFNTNSQSNIYRIEYSNDTAASLSRNSLSTARTSPSATGNSVYGWWVAGALAPGPTPQSIVDRMEFSNDTGTLSPRAFLPYGRAAMGATSNSNYGWFAGGYTALATNKWSTVQRMDFSNDSPTTASPRGPLSSARYGTGGAGNDTYGWFIAGGGSPSIPAAVSTVDRIDYSNDTVLTSVRGPLSVSIGYQGSTSNYVKGDKGVLTVARKPFIEIWSIFTATSQAKWAGVLGTYGWFAGHQLGTGRSDIDRIDFANDSPTTASPRGPLSLARGSSGGATDGTFGWFSGGYFASGGAQFSRIDRIDFANDSPTTASTRASTTVNRAHYAALQNSDFAWLAGGKNTTSTVDRIDYGNDTATPILRGNLLVLAQGRVGLSNQFYGWAVGGEYISSVERIDFANDSPTSGSPRGPLTNARARAGSVGNSNYGWIIGGAQPTGVSVVERIDYSNDSPTAASTRVSSGATTLNAWGNAGNANYGWIGGGSSTSVFRIDYANDTTVPSPRGLLTVSREFPGGTSNYVTSRSQPAGTTTSTAYFPASATPKSSVVDSGAGTFGWFTGGYQAGSKTNIDRIDFSNDSPTTASPRGQFPTGKNANAGTSNASYAWITGGGSPNQEVHRIDFASDLIAPITRGAMTTGRNDLAAAGNANYGWFGGGAPAAYSLIARIDYASDTSTPSIRGPLSQGRQSGSAVGNANYGWWTGGYAPGNVSTVDRVDFSNDSPTTASVRGALPITNRDTAAHGTANYGWVSGGSPTISTVYRIDYSTDTASATTRGPLSKARSNFKGAGNAGYGWVGPSGTGDSSIDRIDYANDSPTTASPRGNISLARFSMAAVSNYLPGAAASPSGATAYIYTTGTSVGYTVTITTSTANTISMYGWFGGGQGPIASVDRIDFSNDSPTSSSPRGPLSTARSQLAASSNVSYGWYSGGNVPGVSTVDRIDFSNDSPTAASPRGPLTVARLNHTATGNANYGWHAGGNPGNLPVATFSSVERINYANDSPNAGSPRGPLNANRAYPAATGNANYGWFAGGAPGSGTSVDRIDYANDSPTAASPRGILSIHRLALSATGNASYGWFAGGGGPGISTVDRIDYANESPTSASPRGPLSAGRYSLAAAGNANYGWWSGGTVPGVVSIVDRIDYANESPTAASPRGPLSFARTQHFGTSNYEKTTVNPTITIYSTSTNLISLGPVTGNYGWWAGGYTTGFQFTSNVERIDFANDSPTTTSPRGNLSRVRAVHASVSNSNYGWFAGGMTTPPTNSTSSIDRIDFSNDGLAGSSPRSFLSVARSGGTAANNANYGWVAGGPFLSSVDRIDFSNDLSIASIRGTLSGDRTAHAATGNANYGWFGGGTPTPTPTSAVDRIDYANDSPTSASPRGPLSQARIQAAATGNSSYGWWMGGYTSPLRSTIDRIDFANDTATAAVRTPLPASLRRQAAAGNNNYGWAGGGLNAVPDAVSSVYRIDFANDSPTAASSRGPLSIIRQLSGAVSNTARDNKTFSAIDGNVGTYGWASGGVGTNASVIDRIDFNNDTGTAGTRGILSASRYRLAAAGNANYGWFGGGKTLPAVVSTVDRIDFANDSPTTASPRGPLSLARQLLAAVSNANYAWFIGGSPTYLSNVDRIDFSNDSPATASPRGFLSVAINISSASGTSNYGWIGGGLITGNVPVSSVYRIDYANDSPATSSPRGPLSATRYQHTTAGNNNYAWHGGGINPGFVSLTTVERVDYSNDSPTSASPRGPLSLARKNLAAGGNANYGWFSGGYFSTPVSTVVSTVDRIDYSNDSPTSASPRGPLAATRYTHAATSNYVQSRTEPILSKPIFATIPLIRGGLSIA